MYPSDSNMPAYFYYEIPKYKTITIEATASFNYFIILANLMRRTEFLNKKHDLS